MIPFYLGKVFRQSGASNDICSKVGTAEIRFFIIINFIIIVVVVLIIINFLYVFVVHDAP